MCFGYLKIGGVFFWDANSRIKCLKSYKNLCKVHPFNEVYVFLIKNDNKYELTANLNCW